MQVLKQKFKNHWVAVVLGVLVSLIVAFPQVYFRIDHRSDGIYQGIELLPDSPWTSRVREIQDGHGLGSVYYKEGKGDPYLHLPLGSMVVAYMGEAFSLDINNTILLSRLVLPFLATLLIYSFVYLLSRDKWAALCSAGLILLADSITGFSGVSKILHGVGPSSFLELARPVYSVMIFVPFFAFLILFWQAYQKISWKWGVASAIVLGSNFYNYFYTWTYLYAFGFILGLALIIKKKWPELKMIVGVFLGALVVAIPYFVNLYKASLYPLYQELSLRHGIVTSHAPIFIGITVTLSIIVFLIGFPREDNKRYFFGLALLLAPILCLNQQILTGKVLQTGHYHWYFHRPLAVIFVLTVVFYWLAKRGWQTTKKGLALVIILASLFTGAFVQSWSYFVDYPTRDGGAIAIARQRYGPVMQWLNNNAKKEEVVLANEETSQITVIYTPLNVYYHRSVQLFLSATEERMLDATFTFYRLNGVDKKNMREVISKDSENISADVYGIYYRDNFGSYALPKEKLAEIEALYEKTLATPTPKWLEQTLKKYEVNYIVWDKVTDPLWRLDQYKFLKKEAEFGTMAIYKVI